MGEEQEERQQNTQNGNVVTDLAKDKVSKEVKEKAKKEAAKRVAETSAKLAGKSSLFAALGPILIWALIIIVAIIIIVGVIMFFMTVPGMVMEQLKNFASDFADAICSWFGADSTKQIEEQEIYDVLNYLEQMGYDLKGYGFISQNADENNANYDEQVGVIRDPDTGLIKDLDEGKWFGGTQEAYSDIINLYIMSDNYVYTVRNFNNVSTWWTGFKWLQALGQHIGDLFGADNTKWGRGLISLYKEDGGNIGKKGDSYQNGIFSWNNIEVDAASKTMKIRKGWGNKSFEYNLDGWTGRYGMPLDFLLSLHIATMKPDLTYEMITEYDTEVQILLRTISEGSIAASYKNSSGRYVTYEEVENAIHASKSDDVFNSIVNWFDDNWGGLNEEEMEVLSNLGFGDDKDTIKEILTALKDANVYDFETFVPYIARVSNHWFRDVYFILSEDEVKTTLLTRTDIDYEKITNERWTLYETYTEEENPEKAGEYKLYRYDENADYGIGELYEGTQAEADEEGIKVVKKQIKTTAADLASDSYIANPNDPESEVGAIIELNSDGSWSAYESKDTESEEYERVYPEEDANSIRGKIYYKVKFGNNAVQKEDGLRGVTNKTIKDMFLNRYYFNYDGSTETADLIKLAREELDMEYGSIAEDKLETEISGTTNPEDDEPYQVKDLVNNVSITQDSLGAFSMLENTHTLDADYIYRDFKELIVELGYFTKEELSEGTPELLQWLIPSIGSAGYPKRVLDKVENELGTFSHSKQDYEANEDEEIKYLLQKVGSEVSNDKQVVDNTKTNNNQQSNNSNGNNNQTANSSQLQLASNSNNVNDVVGATSTSQPVGDRSPRQVSLQEYLDTTREMCEKINDVGYDYCVYRRAPECPTCSEACKSGWDTNLSCLKHSGACSCTEVHCSHKVHGKDNQCRLSINFNESQTDVTKYNFCCATLVSWSLQNVGVMPEDFVIHGAESLAAYCLNELGGERIEPSEPLQEGDILCYEGHIDICGEEVDGGYAKYNGGHYTDTGSIEYQGTSCIEKISGWPSNALFAVRLNWGEKDVVGAYEGYLGDEAVVSPVTGILLDYGTYNDDDVAAGYRTNVNKISETDKVGYAKILVLNEEIADQLVNCSVHSKDTNDKDGIKGQIDVSKPQEAKDMKNWSDEAKALYGYKLFKDDYEDGGIAGYIIYIDGFKCELPNPDNQEEDNREEIVWDEEYDAGSGQELSMEYFKEKAAKGTGNSFQNCKYEETLYEADEVYKLLSEKLEKQQAARSEAKSIAAPLYSFTGTIDGESKELLLIKEGTVIGRTFTDKEVVESRGETYVKPEEPKEGEEDTREVQGNYLRIIMRDLDDTVVENVEDYMKLDELEYSQELDFEKFLYWLGVYLEGGVLEEKGGKWISVSKDLGDGVGGTHYFGLTHYVSDLAEKLGYNVGNWSDDKDLEMLVDVYLALIEEDKAYVKEQLGEDISDGYLQAFISIKHNYGNLTKRGNEYKSKGQVSESTWTTYEDPSSKFAKGLTNRRIAEWYIITEGKYMNAYEGNTAEIEFPSETPFTDWCKEHGITNIQVKTPKK